jgi:hypothetical protein
MILGKYFQDKSTHVMFHVFKLDILEVTDSKKKNLKFDHILSKTWSIVTRGNMLFNFELLYMHSSFYSYLRIHEVLVFNWYMQVLLLMRNLSTNLTSPDFEEHVSYFVCPFLWSTHISFKTFAASGHVSILWTTSQSCVINSIRFTIIFCQYK